MMTHQDQQVTCTGDVWCGCTCQACTVTFEHCQPSPVVSTGDELDVALALDKAANLLTLVANDLEAVLPQLRDGHPMWCSVDIVSALGHLRIAARKVDQAADRINAPAVAR
ncbi:hypothetical protein MPHO_40520 [Mycolicibacterium phocaicum]|uniref:Uncharacterized protein n=1 Tax=Mycolicibacterium phocaicum TaxID=319706 RepID=A0A7I7ZSI4_9MYCO|nr:hypothetical protein C1S79_25830 [Mycolicibacterium phocaicum]BBZ57060.1 hypothetical protein MPHO_40520 [Mycolicibacterium phocaicum]